MVYSLSPSNLLVNSELSSPYPHIDQKHWEEWKKSGVSDEIIALNVWSEYDSREIDKLLNRKAKSRWKHSDDLIPAWCVAGIDPVTGEKIFSGSQIKPDVSPVDKDGNTQKYLNAHGYDVAPLFLNTGDPEYWQKVIQNKSIDIFIGEGAKKAGAALSIGLSMISIPGVSTCRKKGRLHESLDLFTGFGRKFYLAFDNDVLTKRPVQNALLGMARELSATGSKVMVLQLPPGDAKGVDDYIVDHGQEAFKALIAQAKTIEEWRDELKEAWQERLEEIKSSKRSKLARHLELIRMGWGHDLRYNELKSAIELAGQPLDLDQVRLKIATEFDLDIPLQDAHAIVELLAKENSFHPVEDYLNDVARQYPDPDISILDSLASKYLGTDDPLHNIYLRKTLIAAIARVKQPGCKHDSATVLVGKQGAGKSTFWRYLFGGDDWFSDGLGDANEKDELMKLHRFWALEWSEFETVYKRKDVSTLKKFMTSPSDPFRMPYSRNVKEYPRKSILIGTTNETEILSDPTGSRRFWIIPVNGVIPYDQLKQERDRIWAAAYALYKSGEQWRLSREQEDLREELNKDFQVQDPWGDAIQNYIQFKDAVTTTEIFKHLDIEPARQDVGLAKRVANILRRFGWERIRKWISGAWVRLWTKNQKDEEVLIKPTETHAKDVSNTTYQKNNDFLVDRSTIETQQEFQKNDPLNDPLDPLPEPKIGKNEKSAESELCDRLVPAKKVKEGLVYWSRSLNNKVKVIKLYPSVKKADVKVAGDAFEAPRLPFEDLLEDPEWTPTPCKPAMYGGEVVTVVGFNSRGREYQIEFSKSKRMEYVKPSQLSNPWMS